MDLYNIGNSFSTLNAAFRDVTKAKELYEKRDSKAGPADITKEELYLNWEKLGREVQAYIKIIEEMPVVKKVRCIADDVLCLTKGKIYDCWWKNATIMNWLTMKRKTYIFTERTFLKRLNRK